MRSVLSISLPEKMASELNQFAKRTGRNKSDVVKESLAIYLWEARFQNVRKRLGAKAKKAGIITEDDVFQTVS
jgi:metal-responsive CopG/Arc/MetJ family transcriptional regulator